jgi:type I restriction enzyme M protein
MPDPSAPAVLKSDGSQQMDPSLRDTESVPLEEDIDEFIEREVKPFAPDAQWSKDDIRIGYEFPVKGLFFKPRKPRPLDEIDQEIQDVEAELRVFLEGSL